MSLALHNFEGSVFLRYVLVLVLHECDYWDRLGCRSSLCEHPAGSSPVQSRSSITADDTQSVLSPRTPEVPELSQPNTHRE